MTDYQSGIRLLILFAAVIVAGSCSSATNQSPDSDTIPTTDQMTDVTVTTSIVVLTSNDNEVGEVSPVEAEVMEVTTTVSVSTTLPITKLTVPAVSIPASAPTTTISVLDTDEPSEDPLSLASFEPSA